ncbi:DUF6350 family protein [Actinocorallia sp. API 0066]|uniref:cell division protein PerM n=1 Tax=Actinocorallia sp. API 0066 TaxID=2896846 RepID=UPI001E621602|nr:DUF6350 family protein [Actinocorallia sp. API 0066]MCD0453164.1 DUF6350 family protein [Actinocorallia sp. API 0066]
MAPARPLAVTGMVAAAWSVALGLVVLTTVTLAGWATAPHDTGIGDGLPGVFRFAVNFWLVAHHAGFDAEVGRVGLLPLGLTLLPAALLYRSGGWIIRAAESRYRQRIGVLQVALLLAAPYATFAVALALIARMPNLQPSPWQAFIAAFTLAVLAGGLGAARAISASRGRVRSGVGALLRLLPDRPRSVVTGVLGALAVLVAAGAILVGASLAVNHREAADLYTMLAPGRPGGALLLLVELLYLPNAVIWGVSFAVGPGFAVGAGTSVSPTGVFLGALPTFPPLAALPEPGPAPVVSLVALLAPFVAGIVGGALTVRSFPSTVYEAAPLWGFLSGALTGAVMTGLAALSGGPLGDGRMATMGPSAWRVGLLTALEVGLAAACAAWIVNWWMFRERRPRRRRRDPEPEYLYDDEPDDDEEPPPAPVPEPPKPRRPADDPFAFVESEPILRRRD